MRDWASDVKSRFEERVQEDDHADVDLLEIKTSAADDAWDSTFDSLHTERPDLPWSKLRMSYTVRANSWINFEMRSQRLDEAIGWREYYLALASLLLLLVIMIWSMITSDSGLSLIVPGVAGATIYMYALTPRKRRPEISGALFLLFLLALLLYFTPLGWQQAGFWLPRGWTPALNNYYLPIVGRALLGLFLSVIGTVALVLVAEIPRVELASGMDSQDGALLSLSRLYDRIDERGIPEEYRDKTYLAREFNECAALIETVASRRIGLVDLSDARDSLKAHLAGGAEKVIELKEHILSTRPSSKSEVLDALRQTALSMLTGEFGQLPQISAAAVETKKKRKIGSVIRKSIIGLSPLLIIVGFKVASLPLPEPTSTIMYSLAPIFILLGVLSVALNLSETQAVSVLAKVKNLATLSNESGSERSGRENGDGSADDADQSRSKTKDASSRQP